MRVIIKHLLYVYSHNKVYLRVCIYNLFIKMHACAWIYMYLYFFQKISLVAVFQIEIYSPIWIIYLQRGTYKEFRQIRKTWDAHKAPPLVQRSNNYLLERALTGGDAQKVCKGSCDVAFVNNYPWCNGLFSDVATQVTLTFIKTLHPCS